MISSRELQSRMNELIKLDISNGGVTANEDCIQYVNKMVEDFCEVSEYPQVFSYFTEQLKQWRNMDRSDLRLDLPKESGIRAKFFGWFDDWIEQMAYRSVKSSLGCSNSQNSLNHKVIDNQYTGEGQPSPVY